MGRQILNGNGETHGSIRGKINSNFEELYNRESGAAQEDLDALAAEVETLDSSVGTALAGKADSSSVDPATRALAANADKYGLADLVPGQRVIITGEKNRSEQFRGDVSGDVTSIRIDTDVVDGQGNSFGGVYHWVPTVSSGPGNMRGVWLKAGENLSYQYLYRNTQGGWSLDADGTPPLTLASQASVPWELSGNFTGGGKTIPASTFTKAPEATENNWLALEPLAEFFKDKYTFIPPAGNAAHEVSELSCQLVAGSVYELDMVFFIPHVQNFTECYVTPDWLPFSDQNSGNNVEYTESYVQTSPRNNQHPVNKSRAFKPVLIRTSNNMGTSGLRHIRGRFLAPHSAEFRPVIVTAGSGPDGTKPVTLDIHGSIRRVTS